MKRNIRYILFVFIVSSLVFMTCQKDSTSISPGDSNNQAVQLQLNLAKNNAQSSVLGNVNRVTVEISGEGLDQMIVKNLSIVGNEARGTFTLPLGSKDIYVVASVTRGAIVIDLFEGSKTINITENTDVIRIDLAAIDENMASLAWHDDNPEQFVWLDTPGSIFAMGFNPNQPVFIMGVNLLLRWQGNDGPFRIVVLDQNQSVIFRSAQPIGAQPDGWVSRFLIWNNPSNGIIAPGEDVFVGLLYDTDLGWPEIGYDTNAPSGNSVFYDASIDQWFYDTGGDFLITVLLQTEGGQKLFVTPHEVFDNEHDYEDWKQRMTRK